jgi:hypothetical protein
VLQMHFAFSFFGGRDPEMMVLPHFEHSAEGYSKTPNEKELSYRWAGPSFRNITDYFIKVKLLIARGVLVRFDQIAASS